MNQRVGQVLGVIGPVFLFRVPKELFLRADRGLEKRVVVLSLTGWLDNRWERLEGSVIKFCKKL